MYSYELKSLGINALDARSTKEPVIDKGKMTIAGVLSTTGRDRQGDILDVAGVDTANHMRNPVVLLDHGMYYALPIGKTQDEASNYTVEIDAGLGEIRDTIYLSQSSPVAEQVFHLYAEGILKAQSIGYREIEVERLPADPEAGIKGGKLIKRCELIEATICGIPANPECVPDILGKGILCGRPLEYAIKAMFNQYKPEKKVMVSVTIPERKNMAEVMSSVDQSAGGALVPDAKSDLPEEPVGKTVLKGLSDHLSAVMDHCTKCMKACENEKVKKLCEKVMKGVSGHLEDCMSLHDGEYGEGEDDDDQDEPDEPEEVESADERDQEKKYTVKSWDDVKNCLKALHKAIDDMGGMSDPEMDTKDDMPAEGEESYSDEEQKKIKYLERAIERREKMYGVR